MAEQENKKAIGIRIGELPGVRPVKRMYRGVRKAPAPVEEEKQETQEKKYVSDIGRQMPENAQNTFDKILNERHENNLRAVVKETLAGAPDAEEILKKCDSVGWNNINEVNAIVKEALDKMKEQPEEEASDENIFATEKYDEPPKDFEKIYGDIEKNILETIGDEDEDWDNEDDEDEDDEDDEDEDDNENRRLMPPIYDLRPNMNHNKISGWGYNHRNMPLEDYHPDPEIMSQLSRDKRTKYTSALELFRHTSEILQSMRGDDIYSQTQTPGFARMFEDAFLSAEDLFSEGYGEYAIEQAVMWANMMSKFGGSEEYLKKLYYRYIIDVIRYKLLYGKELGSVYKEAISIIAEMAQRS